MQAAVQIQTSSPPALPGTALATSLNNALATLYTLSASASAPASGTLGYSIIGTLWHDLTTGNLNIRNQADTAWLLWGNVNETLGSITSPQPFGVALNTSTSGTYQVPNSGVASVFVSAGTASGLVQLPPGPPANFTLFVIKTDTSANSVAVSASGGQLINGVASATVSAQWATIRVKADPSGAYWVKW